jgi:hypothetical protein
MGDVEASGIGTLEKSVLRRVLSYYLGHMKLAVRRTERRMAAA